MRIQELSIKGFRGQNITVTPNGNSVLIEGPNGKGKSTVLEAISYAVSGAIPGKKILDNDALLTMCGPEGGFDIELSDDAQGKVRRSFTGTRAVVRANFGDRSTSAVNSDHERAIEDRFGNCVSPLLFDTKRIIDMPPNELRNLVLRLCHDAAPESQWTYRMVVDFLFDKLPRLKNENVVPEDNNTGIGKPAFDALTFLDVLARIFADATTECRREVRELNTILNAEAPIDRPDPEEVRKMQDVLATKEAEMIDLQRAFGALNERKRQIEAGNEAATNQYRYSEQYIGQARAAVVSAQATVDRYTASLATAKIDLAGIIAQNPHREVPEVSTGASDLFGDSHAGSTGVEFTEPEPVPEQDYDATIKARESQLASLIADWDNICEGQRDLQTRLIELNGEIRAQESRMDKYRNGKCPECGQDVAGIVAEVKDTLADMIGRRANLTSLVNSANTTCVQRQGEVAAARGAIARLTANKAEHDKRHADWVNRRERAISEAANRINMWESSKRLKEQEIDSLTDAVNRFRDTLAEAQATLETALANQKHADAISIQEVPEQLTREIAALDADMAERTGWIEAYRIDLDAKLGAITALAEFNRRQAEAETQKQNVQNRQKILTDAADLIPELLNLIVRQMVAPLVDQVNAFIPPHLGRFAVLFQPSFSVGIIRPSFNASTGETVEHFTALRALSTAEACIVIVLIQRALIALSGSRFPVILLDNIEVMDALNWSMFQSFVQTNRANMQVIAAGRRSFESGGNLVVTTI